MRSALAGAYCAAVVLMVVGVGEVKADDRQAEYLQLRMMIGEQRFREAGDRCRALIALYPDYVYLYETLAEIALYAQDLDGVAKYFEERIEDGTGLEMSYFGLGTVHFNMAAYREAALCFDRAIELGNTASECYRSFVYAYERLEGVDASIRFFNSLCHRNPKNPHLWYAVALAYWSKRDYPTVLKSLDEALSRNPTEEKYQQARAAVLVLLGRRLDGMRLISEILGHQIQPDDLNGRQFLHSYLILCSELQADSSNAKVWTQRSLREAEQYGQYRWVGWAYERMADYEFLSSNFAHSLDYSTMAIIASARSMDNVLELAGRIRQYECQMELGNYRDALNSVHSRLAHFTNANHSGDSIRAFVDIAWAYHEMGEDKVAIDYMIESLNRAELAKPNPPNLLRIQSTLGLIQEGLGSDSAALNCFLSSLEYVADDKVGIQNRAIVHGNIGRAYLNLGNLTKAYENFKTELKITTEAGFGKEEAYAHEHLGHYYLKRGMLDNSGQQFLAALSLGAKLGQKQVMLASTRGLALVAEARGKFEQAAEYYKRTIEISDGMAVQARHPWALSKLTKNRDDDCREWVRLVCAAQRFEEAFSLSDMCKTRNALFTSTLSKCIMREIFSEKTRARLAAIEQQLMEKRRLAAEERESKFSRVQSPNFQLADEVARLEIERSEVLENNGIRFPQIEDHSRGQRGLLRWLQDSFLLPEEALIEFNIAKSESHVFLVTKDTLICHSVDISRNDLGELISNVSTIFDAKGIPEGILNASLADFNPQASRKLYLKLCSTLEPFLQGKRALIIVADDILRGFPLESLICSPLVPRREHGFAGANFLQTKFSIRYTRSAALLDSNGKLKGSRTKFLLALGNPRISNTYREPNASPSTVSSRLSKTRYFPRLPGAQREVKAIESVLGAHADVISGDQATKQRFLSAFNKYRILHIASHLAFDREDPLFSSIYLADNPETGKRDVLHAFELLGMDIPAELVVLSSCNSARQGFDRQGDGLAAAFAVAGVPSVIATLWNVDDQVSAYLMERFYFHLSKSNSKSRSLQLAKGDLIESGKIDPYYWAPYVLFGDDSIMELPAGEAGQEPRWAFALLLAASVLIATLSVWKVRGFPRSPHDLFWAKRGATRV